jgi:isoleucyl-tRNA synthetase
LEAGSVTLDATDIQVRLQAKEGWAAAQGTSGVVVLSTELNDALLAEGLAREFMHAVQSQRKDIGCEYTDRIEIGVVTDSDELSAAVRQFADSIRAETLAVSVGFAPLAGVEPLEANLAGQSLKLYVKIR